MRSTPFWHAEHAKGVGMFVLCEKILKETKKMHYLNDGNISATDFAGFFSEVRT